MCCVRGVCLVTCVLRVCVYAAKRAMLGSTRMMLGAGLLYMPFATTMLVMYDKFAIKLVTGTN